MGRKVSLLTLFFFLAPVICFTQNKFTIYPGQGVGTIRLQTLQKNVNMGSLQPSKINKVFLDRNKDIFQMWLSYADVGMTFVYDGKTKELNSIIITDPLYNVQGTRLKVGDKKSRILSAWGNPESETPDGEKHKMRFEKKGMEFWIDSTETIFAIAVFSPK